MTRSKPQEIADRIRKVVFPDGTTDVAAAAQRLGVPEVSLRMSIDDLSPMPTLDVIFAVVHYYGMDPSYLMTGECDPAVHRQVLDAAYTPADIAKAVSSMRSVSSTTPKVPAEFPFEQPRLRLVL